MTKTAAMPSPKAARQSRGLSPRELADRVPCAMSTVYVCEGRRSYPKNRALRSAYLRALGLDQQAVAS
jgi:ribosome-binding protein aMBF1 (putative translation factor)